MVGVARAYQGPPVGREARLGGSWGDSIQGEAQNVNNWYQDRTGVSPMLPGPGRKDETLRARLVIFEKTCEDMYLYQIGTGLRAFYNQSISNSSSSFILFHSCPPAFRVLTDLIAHPSFAVNALCEVLRLCRVWEPQQYPLIFSAPDPGRFTRHAALFCGWPHI